MTIYEYALSQFKADGSVIRISNPDGTILLMDYCQPGYGGFGNLKAERDIIVDGKPAEFVSEDDLRRSVRDRQFRFK